jgi:hypothetical protein
MAFPQVTASAKSFKIASGQSHNVTLPSGIILGDLLIIFFSVDDNETITWPDGYTDIITLNNGTSNTFSVAYRQADGTEGSSITVTTGTNEKSAHSAYRITGHEDPAIQAPEVSTGVDGNSNSPDPDGLTPTGGAKDYLWIAAHAHDTGVSTSAFPTNYDSNQVKWQGTGLGAVGVAVATDEVNAASEDPGTFTINAARAWVACTVAVHPAAAETIIGADRIITVDAKDRTIKATRLG